jgi:pyruvate dehydrogenase E2 component (dihydrolipoamide acetyltransferase)
LATHDIFMPALSSTMTEGKIVEWLKQPGQRVERGDSVLVVESDKADMDVEAFHGGFLAAVLMPAGGTAPVGETIGLIVDSEAEIATAAANAPAAPAATAPVASAPVATAPAATAPASPAPSKAPSSPVVAAPVVATPVVAPPAVVPTPAAVASNGGRVVASPRAKKLASQLGVVLEGLRGSGPHGRIQAEDVLAASGQPISVPRVAEASGPVAAVASASNGAAAPAAAAAAAAAPAAAPLGQAFGRPGETVAFNTLQQAVNRSMVASLSAPCFHVGYTITTDKLDAFYKKVKGKGVTMTALLAKAVGVVLARHPQVNATITDAGMLYPAAVNVAVAVAMEDGGLITPVLANTDSTDIYSLARNWVDLVARARSKQLKPEEYSTGTFTLSNLGMFGVDRFDAILPPGTGAILAVAASRPTVVAAKDGSISVKNQMQVNLTCDHRTIYGAHAAAFLKDLAQLIETAPESLAF